MSCFWCGPRDIETSTPSWSEFVNSWIPRRRPIRWVTWQDMYRHFCLTLPWHEICWGMARKKGNKRTERKQLRTELKMFDIEAWKLMDSVRDTDPVLFLKIRNTLVEQNRPYAVSVAVSFQRRYARTSDLQDLIQSACLGLTSAVERFDPRRGSYKLEDFDPAKGGFTSYASNYILSELRKWVRKDRVVAKPAHHDAPSVLKKLYREFVAAHDREPEPGELDLPSTTTLAALKRAVIPAPRTTIIWHPDDGSSERRGQEFVSEGLTPEEFVLKREEEEYEGTLLEGLTKQEKFLVQEVIMNSRPPGKVGAEMKPPLSSRQVTQLVKEVTEKLRKLHATPGT